MMDFFNEFHAHNGKFYHNIMYDADGLPKNIFWSHASCRANYSDFGDVVTFDTTFKTNRYNMPLAMFVGANHHFQTVIFGAVLLTEETTDAFHHQWVEEERVCMYTCKRAIGRFAKKNRFLREVWIVGRKKTEEKIFLVRYVKRASGLKITSKKLGKWKKISVRLMMLRGTTLKLQRVDSFRTHELTKPWLRKTRF